MLTTIIIFLVLLGILVLVHEFGHFIVAKKSGMQVEEFGIGFPPRLFTYKKGETTYSINLIPLGGFVKIIGENNEGADNPNSFINKGFWPRFLTLIAGVTMNIILAWVLLSIALSIGMPTAIAPGDQVPAHGTLKGSVLTVLEVAPDSPSAEAGIKPGDALVSVNNQPTTNPEQFIDLVKANTGREVQVQAKRGDEEYSARVLVRENPPEGQGQIGIALGNVGRLSYPWYIAPIEGAKATWHLTKATVVGFGNLIFQGKGIDQLGGPVKIAELTGDVAKLGSIYLIQFAALLSINLAVLNSVPFPALDGGRVLFLFIEKIRGKRNNEKIEQFVNAAGFFLLILLILYISFNDVKGLL
jgi:regulator of sigma E protease